MKISDRPIAAREEDVLGRWGLAKTIFELIMGARLDSALKIGVYGGWGEGKTSVLRFVETQAVRANVPVCWFSVWSAQTQADLWASLIDALRSLPAGADWKTGLKKFAARATSKTEGLAELNPYTKTAHALGRLATGSGMGATDAVRVLDRVRQNARVVILVDDVDRADGVLIPKLLMGLHELFDELEKCAVVIALDPDVIAGALGRVNPAWTSAPAFLEKIVQYPFWLSRPSEGQIRSLIAEALRESRVAVPEKSVLDLLDLLPKNPRKVKQFIRSLERLRTTLARFGEDEWNPALLLMLELLRTASAEAAEILLHDQKFLEEFVAGNFLVRREEMHEDGKATKAQLARI